MDIEILDLVKFNDKFKIGVVFIRYHELIIRGELVFHPKDRKAWVRMPEKWVNQEKKLHLCYWPTKEISDNFQKEVLRLIFDRHNLNIDKIEKIHQENAEERGKITKP